MRFRSLLAAIMLALVSVTNTAIRAQCPDGPGDWVVRRGQMAAGPMGEGVFASISFDLDGPGPRGPSLVVGGAFEVAGTAATPNIAVWNGSEWTGELGGFNDLVRALFVYNGELHAGGEFTIAGGVPANRVARWRNGAWEPLGAGVDGAVAAFAEYNGRLYVGGTFSIAGGLPANRIASWDGSAWGTLGNQGPNGGGGVSNPTPYPGSSVLALAAFNGRLYVGGSFTHVNGFPYRSLATWDGSNWGYPGALGYVSPQTPFVSALMVHQTPATGASTLFVGGDFDWIDNIAARALVTYTVTPTSSGPWMPFPAAAPLQGSVGDLLVDLDESGNIMSAVATVLDRDSDLFGAVAGVQGVYRHESGAWTRLSGERVNGLAQHDGEVLMFPSRLGVQRLVNGVGRPLAMGLDRFPNVMLSAGDDLLAFGAFTFADGQPVQGAARLDTSGAWHAMGSAPAFSPYLLSSAEAAALDADGSIFVSGAGFEPQSVFRVLRWDGQMWVNVYARTRTGALSSRDRMLEVGERPNQRVYLLTDNVYRWNGAAFELVGPPEGFPYARKNDAFLLNGQLHVASDVLFRLSAAETAWEFVTHLPWTFGIDRAHVWRSHPSGAPRLYLSGGDTPVSAVHEYTGGANPYVVTGNSVGVASWSPAEFRGSLFAVMNVPLSSPPYPPPHRFYARSVFSRYDGAAWQHGPAVLHGAGGAFLHKGQVILPGTMLLDGRASPLFARLTCCPADFNSSGGVDATDLFVFLDAWFTENGRTAPAAGTLAADFNASGAVDATDIFVFLDAWFRQNGGC